MKNSNERLMIVVAIMLGIAALAIDSLILFDYFSKKDRSVSARIDAGQQQVDSSNSASSTPRFFEVPEMGIKIKLGSISSEEIIYAVEDHRGIDGSDIMQASISTASLDVLSDGDCAPGEGSSPLGMIFKTKSPSAEVMRSDITVFNINDEYVYIVPPQATCTEDASIESKAQELRDKFFEDFKTISSLK